MSKRRKKARKPQQATARFKVGDRVRVRPGTRDTEHPDIPLGGWAGTVARIHNNEMYCIRWSRETLARIHPLYKKRCAIDGAVMEEYWLEESALEPDHGGPLTLEQPTAIIPRPLSAEEQGDRVRMVFGLTSDDFLPVVTEDSLETYYDFLVERLSLPLEAKYQDEEDFSYPRSARRVQVLALDREIGWDEGDGIFCEVQGVEEEDVVPLASLKVKSSDPNYQLIEDYSAWFLGDLADQMEGADEEFDEDEEEYEGDDDEDEEASEEDLGLTPADAPLVLLEITVFAVCFGACVGAAVATMPWTKWAAIIGGSILGPITAYGQMRQFPDETDLLRLYRRFDGMIGLFTGAIRGAFLGIAVVALPGAVLGAIVGLVLRRFVQLRKGVVLHVFPGGVWVAAGCGVIAQAFYFDRTAAATGLWQGALLGLGAWLVLALLGLILSFFFGKWIAHKRNA